MAAPKWRARRNDGRGSAAQKMGGPRAELRYYHLVPEWITGMGIVVGQA